MTPRVPLTRPTMEGREQKMRERNFSGELTLQTDVSQENHLSTDLRLEELGRGRIFELFGL